jgi:hypothetical protein
VGTLAFIILLMFVHGVNARASVTSSFSARRRPAMLLAASLTKSLSEAGHVPIRRRVNPVFNCERRKVLIASVLGAIPRKGVQRS